MHQVDHRFEDCEKWTTIRRDGELKSVTAINDACLELFYGPILSRERVNELFESDEIQFEIVEPIA